jgi:hypothetical protein
MSSLGDATSPPGEVLKSIALTKDDGHVYQFRYAAGNESRVIDAMYAMTQRRDLRFSRRDMKALSRLLYQFS